MTTRKTKSAGKRTARKTTKSAARAKTKRADGRKNAGGLRVRMYRVGFGDFFLVTVPTTSHGNQYILIDCGVFKGTSGTGDIGSIVEAVEDMYQTTNGHLALVIMTHRHADHIAGFSKAQRFKDFTASMVWMPYWEQFNDDKSAKKPASKSFALEDEDENAAHLLQLDIQALAENLAMQFGSRKDPDAQEALAQLGNATGIEDFSAAAKDKKRRGGNAAALDLLKNHLGANGNNVRYYAAGDKAELPNELKGLTATILGPPPKKAKAFLALMDLKKGVGQYLDSVTDGDDGPKAIQPFPTEWSADSPKDYPKKDLRRDPIDYNRCIQDVNNAQPDMLAAAAGKIENFLNNQSLVVLFEFGGKKLLFAGDAQGGNWEYWLFKMDEPMKDPTKAGDLVDTSKELLETIDFYKVGHHGSTNATPIQAVEAAIARPKSSTGFVSMCSTEDEVYGNPDKETEVPRSLLMKVLNDGSCLLRSDSIAVTFNDENKKSITIKARKGVELPEPKVGKLSKTNLYIEYSF
jgi:beta-lactamase superfamily II metal-dependent hydrolase